MTPKHNRQKKLKLQRETIRNLRDLPIDLLEGIHGGLGGTKGPTMSRGCLPDTTGP